MLDALEAGLLVLRTTNESLMAELRLANRQLESAPAPAHRAKRKSRRSPAKKRRSTAKKRESAKVLELPHQTAEQEERSLGKRRALGRSILQLRKPAAAAPAGGPENSSEERGLFQRDRPKPDEAQ
jgi:hypothetical protein